MSEPGGQPTATPDEPLVPPSAQPAAPSRPGASGSAPSPDAGGWPPPPPPWQAYGAWPPAAAPAAPADPSAVEALRKARTALGWAVGAAVGAGLALVGTVVALLLAGSSAIGGYETLRGEVVGLSDGSALPGDELVQALVDGLEDLGAQEVDVTCPDTASVSVSTVVVCRGTVEGYEWTGVVVFEDSTGSFAVVEL